MRIGTTALAAWVGIQMWAGQPLAAQETPPPPPETPAAESPKEADAKETVPYRPIEGPVIINLPSVDVPKAGTLTVLFAHRFSQALQDATFNNLFTFDSAANIGIGAAYAPVKNLDISFYRYSNDVTDYEFAAKYAAFTCRSFALSLRIGGDDRSAQGLNNRSTFFAQAILAYTFAPWARITAVPTYLNRTAGLPVYFEAGVDGGLPAVFQVSPEPVYTNVFNVPVAASIAITQSITLHGEVTPSWGRTVLVSRVQPDCGTATEPRLCPASPQHSSPGVGWIVSVEKTLPRHRFAFTAGNVTQTTADQYLVSNFGGKPGNVYIGFTLSRQWGIGH